MGKNNLNKPVDIPFFLSLVALMNTRQVTWSSAWLPRRWSAIISDRWQALQWIDDGRIPAAISRVLYATANCARMCKVEHPGYYEAFEKSLFRALSRRYYRGTFFFLGDLRICKEVKGRKKRFVLRLRDSASGHGLLPRPKWGGEPRDRSVQSNLSTQF